MAGVNGSQYLNRIGNIWQILGHYTIEKPEKMIYKPSEREYETLIFTFRGIKVMNDYDLALLYSIPTKRLKEQVKRNLQRFPPDFMFILSKAEISELVANCDRLASLKHSSVLPFAFIEQAVAMLSSIRRTEEAIRINIEIMRVFTRYRAFLIENKELRSEIKALAHKLNSSVLFLLKRIDFLHQKDNKPRNQIGFKKTK